MPLHSLTRRIVLGTLMAAAGIAMLLARPDAALAHHVEVDEEASCAGWTVRADYVGGSGDRMVVVDIVVNGVAMEETFIFDNDHLGHPSLYELYEISGTGSLKTSGTVTMYEWGGSSYSRAVETDYTDIDLVCATATPTSSATRTATATATATSTATATATPTATNTPVPTATSTPTPEETVETSGSVTPIPTATATPDTTTESSITPLATETPSAQGSTTPLATNTPSTNRNPRTATSTAVIATPTFTDEVQGGTPPAQPPSQPSGPD